MKTIKLWACTKNSDQTEGRGYSVDVCFAATKALALQIVNSPAYYERHGVMGCPPYQKGEYDVQERTLVVFDDFKEFDTQADRKAKRKKALAKLTSEDKEILGIKE